ncbi:3-hydroxyacyl-ACP dehydratase [Brachyspira alvinipulli]|uniref:ApeI family dehydratase n=1 Tax=Brachyspira alvinipulli TaxID=84379 RepID=UPI00300717B8
MNNYTIEEQSSDMFKVKVFIDEKLPYFDGHFDNFKLLPAVAQIKIIIDISKNIFSKDIIVTKLLKIKFTNMIFPNSNIIIEGIYANSILSFKIYDEDKKYSDGKIYFA